MVHTDQQRPRLAVAPALEANERIVLLDLAGVRRVRRIWSGQPRSHSLWLPCPAGCCLLPAPGTVGDERALWLRFLVREVLAPRSVPARTRAAEVGLGQAHRMDGRVVVTSSGERSHVLSVKDNRVRDHFGARSPTARAGAHRGRGPDGEDPVPA